MPNLNVCFFIDVASMFIGLTSLDPSSGLLLSAGIVPSSSSAVATLPISSDVSGSLIKPGTSLPLVDINAAPFFVNTVIKSPGKFAYPGSVSIKIRLEPTLISSLGKVELYTASGPRAL